MYLDMSPKPHDLIGAIDTGSNAIRFSVYRLNVRLAPVIQFRKRFPVRLGTGTFTAGVLTDADMDAAIAAFQEIARIGREQNVIAMPAVATSAIREAGNCDHFVARVKTETGIDLRAVTGDEEARLAAQGVASVLKRKDGNLIIDIGGGSTEIIRVTADGEIAGVVSLPLGAVRLAEHCGMPDLYEADALSEIQELIENAISKSDLQSFVSPPHTTCIGGTACALANAARLTENGGSSDHLELEDLADTTAELIRLNVNSIARTACIDDARARLIIPGAYILTAILSYLKIKEIYVSDAGVREGLVSAYLATPVQSEPAV